MHRFFVPEENIREREIRITGDDVNHIKNVLRMKPGEQVVVSCGKGMDYFCMLQEIKEEAVCLSVTEQKAAVTELPVKITLFQALPKNDKMEFVIQKAIELGAAEIIPFRAKRCIVKLDEKKEEKKRLRWQAIAESAAKQSGRGKVPDIGEIMDFSQALDYAGTIDTVLIPYELCEDMESSAETIQNAVKGNSIAVFIGPEGGFERSEVEEAVSRGAAPISLGKRILRTETAGMAVLSVLMFLIEGRQGK